MSRSCAGEFQSGWASQWEKKQWDERLPWTQHQFQTTGCLSWIIRSLHWWCNGRSSARKNVSLTFSEYQFNGLLETLTKTVSTSRPLLTHLSLTYYLVAITELALSLISSLKSRKCNQVGDKKKKNFKFDLGRSVLREVFGAHWKGRKHHFNFYSTYEILDYFTVIMELNSAHLGLPYFSKLLTKTL